MDRIEARVDPERAQRIREAAKLSHASVSSFVVEAASEKAEKVIARQTTTTVPGEFFDSLLKALDGPAKTIPALKKAAARSTSINGR